MESDQVPNKQPTTIPILHDEGGNIIRDNVEKAKLLNDFFTKYFNRVLRSLKRSDYEEINQTITDECPTDLLCTVEVERLLLSLDTTKSSGCDGISATMLKVTAHSIASGITKLFNMSIQTGVIPELGSFPRLSNSQRIKTHHCIELQANFIAAYSFQAS